MKYALILALLASPLAAEELQQTDTVGRLSADIGLGVAYSPNYEGGDEMAARPWLLWKNTDFTLRGSESSGNGGSFSISPSLNYVGKRDGDTDDALIGMDEVDASLELGAKLGYRFGDFSTFVAARYGAIGHEGIVGEAGFDYRSRVSDKLTFWTGPRVSFANDDYMSTYFGVTDAEAAETGYSAYAPEGGVKSAGLKLQMRYALGEKTSLYGEASYDKLVGDAADSPLTQDEDQAQIKFGVTRRFSFGF